MNNDNIEKLLLNFAEKKAGKNKNGKADNEIDFNLVAAYLDGTATQEECEKVEKLREENDVFAQLVEPLDLKREEHIGVFRLKNYFTPRVLRMAASFLLIVTAGSFVTYYLGLTPGNDAENTLPSQRVLRGSSSEAFDNIIYNDESGIYAVGKSTDDKIKLYDSSYALLIGIDEYAPETTGLMPGTQSAKNVQLIQSALKQFQFTEIHTLTDEDATRSKIITKITRLMCKAGSKGAVFVYFSGSSCNSDDTESKNAYLVPYNGSVKNGECEERNISLDTIKSLAEIMKVENTCIALDCELMEPGKNMEKVSNCNSVQMLIASDDESEYVEGLFAKVFAYALEQSQSRPYVTINEIADCVISNVETISLHEYNSWQRPFYIESTDDEDEFKFAGKLFEK